MIARILIVLCLLLLGPAAVLVRLLPKPQRRRWPAIALLAPNAVLLAALAATAFHESYSATADALKGALLSLTLIVAVPEVVLALLLGVSRIFRPRSVARRAVVALAVTLALTALGVLVTGFTYGPSHFVSRRFSIARPDVPAAFDGYRIAHISDMHLGTQHLRPSVVRTMVDSINAQRPDLVLFTGDFVNYRAEEMPEFEAELRRIEAPDGVVAVMGNHDYMGYYRFSSERAREENISMLRARVRALGWTLLLNDNTLVRRDSDALAIVGLENHGDRPAFPQLADLPKAETGLPDGVFRILLQHDPSYWRRHVVPQTDYPLMLAGHTHAMQFQIGSWSPAAWIYDEWGGLYDDGRGHALLVSPGVGEVLLPFRFGAWPEIDVVTLRRTP